MEINKNKKCMVFSELQAECHIKYGLYSEFEKGYPHHELFLSDKAAKQLWEKVKDTVTLGLSHFSIKPI